jgi:hypothetical protein
MIIEHADFSDGVKIELHTESDSHWEIDRERLRDVSKKRIDRFNGPSV